MDGKIIKKSKRIKNTKFRTIKHGECEWGKNTQGTSTVLLILFELAFYLFFNSIHSITILYDFILKKNTFLYISNMSYKTAREIKKLT